MVLQLYTFPKCLSQLIFKPHQENHSRDFKALTQVAVPSWRLTRFVFWALLLIPKKTVCLEKVSKLPLWDISECVRASKLRRQLQNASCGQKLPIPGISVPESHLSVRFLSEGFDVKVSSSYAAWGREKSWYQSRGVLSMKPKGSARKAVLN